MHSGTISFKSNPQSVSASLNGAPSETNSLNRINNSFNISGLLPADYEIKISTPDFYAWEKKIDVHSGVSSEFWNVVLTRNNYEKTKYDETAGIEKFFTSPKNRSIAFTTNSGQNLFVKILELNNETITGDYDFPGWKLLAEEKKENIEWSPEEDYLSVPVEKKIIAENNNPQSISPQNSTQYAYYIIELASGDTLNLNDFLNKKEIRHVRWDPKEKGYLFFMEGNSLFRANVKDNSDVVLIADNAAVFDLSYSSVYYLQTPNKLIFKTSTDGKAEKTQITSKFPETNNSAIEKIILYDEDRIAFLDQARNLFVYNKGEHGEYFRKLGTEILEMHFSDDGKKLLFWSNNEISVYFIRDWTVQPTRQENDLNNITRYSEPLENIQWYKDYEHIIFSAGKYAKIIELDARDHRNCLDLINTEIDAPFINHNHSLEKLFFTDQKDGQTFLNSIVFPEPVPILGIGG